MWGRKRAQQLDDVHRDVAKIGEAVAQLLNAIGQLHSRQNDILEGQNALLAEIRETLEARGAGTEKAVERVAQAIEAANSKADRALESAPKIESAGLGVESLLEKLLERLPPPQGHVEPQLDVEGPGMEDYPGRRVVRPGQTVTP